LTDYHELTDFGEDILLCKEFGVIFILSNTLTVENSAAFCLT